jgi:glycosyltransferase involved in cell wall biosynthesis
MFPAPNEIIVVDDASVDQSQKIITESLLGFNSSKFISNEVNRGQSYSRNLGVMNSSHDFIIFMDDDDLSLRNRAEIHLNAFREGAEISYVSSVKKYSNGFSAEFVNSDFTSSSRDEINLIKYFILGREFSQNLRLYSPSCSLAVNKKAFLRAGGFNIEMRRLEDIDFASKCLQLKLQIQWSSKTGVERQNTFADDKSPLANLLGEKQLLKNFKDIFEIKEYFIAYQMIKFRYAYFAKNFIWLVINLPLIILILVFKPIKIKSILSRLNHDLKQKK